MYHLCKMCICSNFTMREIFTDDRGASARVVGLSDTCSRASPELFPGGSNMYFQIFSYRRPRISTKLYNFAAKGAVGFKNPQNKEFTIS